VAAELVAEQVADHIEDVAEVTRHINATSVRYFLGGVCFGAALGFYIGYRYNREKIKAEAFKESEEEIENIREHYQQKVKAYENSAGKADLSEIVVREGYTPGPAEGPDVILQGVDYDRSQRPLKPMVPVDPAKRVFRSTNASKDKMDGWNFPKELSHRSHEHPYIIHQDEFAQNETEYAQVTYTYYAEDDVLLDEAEEIILDRDDIVGSGVLNRFGHGTDDFNILYVCNPVLELEIEICRTSGSYEVEVLGLEHGSSNDESS
jgi:hypothetical protein